MGNSIRFFNHSPHLNSKRQSVRVVPFDFFFEILCLFQFFTSIYKCLVVMWFLVGYVLIDYVGCLITLQQPLLMKCALFYLVLKIWSNAFVFFGYQCRTIKFRTVIRILEGRLHVPKGGLDTRKALIKSIIKVWIFRLIFNYRKKQIMNLIGVSQERMIQKNKHQKIQQFLMN